jgi:hypothetical protein
MGELEAARQGPVAEAIGPDNGKMEREEDPTPDPMRVPM